MTDAEIETRVAERIGRAASMPTQPVVPIARVEPMLTAGFPRFAAGESQVFDEPLSREGAAED